MSKTAYYASMVIVIPAAFFSHTFVTMKLWLWFGVPLGLPTIGFWHTAGIVLLVGMMRLSATQLNTEKTDSMDALAEYIGKWVIAPWFGLGVGSIIRLLTF